MIDALEQLYEKQQSAADAAARREAELCLEIRDFYLRFAKMDPFSGDALPRGFSEWLTSCAPALEGVDKAADRPGYPQDRFVRLLQHSLGRLPQLLKNLRRNVTRDYAMLPIHAIREMDSNCLMWLSRQPGRSIRQKLSGRQSALAVRRQMSPDTSENRLLKAFLEAVRDKTDMRHKYFPKPLPGELSEILEAGIQWLQGTEAAEIGHWNNPLPNNVLLQDKDYRKIWQAWKWLLNMGEDIEYDERYVSTDALKYLYWQLLYGLFCQRDIYFIEQPCKFDYDKLKVSFGSAGWDDADEVRGFFRKGKEFHPFVISYTQEKVIDLWTEDSEIYVSVDRESQKIMYREAQLPQAELAGFEQEISATSAALLQLLLEKWGVVYEHRILRKEGQDAKDLPLGGTLVLDFSQAYLQVLSAAGLQQNPQRTVCQFLEDRKELQSTRYARAMVLCHEGEDSTREYSLRSLCLPEQRLDEMTEVQKKRRKEQRLEAARLLVSETREFAESLDRSPQLVYLLPDGADDFGLAVLRQQFNLFFKDSMPLPRSIAGAFALAAEQGCFPLKDGEWLIVADEQGFGVTLTPILVQVDVQLKKQYPKGQGVIFERHPTQIVRSANEMAKALAKGRPPGLSSGDWQSIISVWGLRGLAEEQEELLLSVADGHPYQELRSQQELQQAACPAWLNEKEIKEISERVCRGEKWKLLDLTEQRLARNLNGTLYLQQELTAGVVVLQEWQSGIGHSDKYLWFDHLPELSMQVRMEERAKWINLVQDGCRVMPKRGQRLRLPAIAAAMSLPVMPADMKELSFPLRVGGFADESIRYQASLRSSQFPLDKEVPVHLEMYYTYGEAEPYELYFVANNGNTRFKALWTEGEEMKCEDWMLPLFPPATKASAFQTDKGKYTHLPHLKYLTLQDVLVHWLEDFSSDLSYLNGGVETTRVSLDLLAEWNEIKRDYWVNSADYEGRRVKVSSRAFASVRDVQENIDKNPFHCKVRHISCELLPARDCLQAYNITEGHSIDKQMHHCWRRPIFTLRGMGLSFEEFPDAIRLALEKYLPRLIAEYSKLDEGQQESKLCVLRFASVLGDDMPPELGQELVSIYKDKKRKKHFVDIERWLGYAMGSVEHDWQQELLWHSFSDHNFEQNPEHLQALSHALWLSPEFALRLTSKQVGKVLDLLLYTAECLLQVKGESSKKDKECVRDYMETALGLVRARRNDDNCWKLLNPQHLQKLIDRTEKIIQRRMEHAESFLVLTVDKPSYVQDMDDLYYAVSRMLSCDNQDESQLIKVRSLNLS